MLADKRVLPIPQKKLIIDMISFIKKIFYPKPKSDIPEITEEAEIRAIVVSDLGLVRTNNEDIGYFIRPYDANIRKDKGFLGIVADGMGGHAAGEVASKTAVETIRTEYYASKENNILKSLKRAFEKANERVYQKSKQNGQLHGMGTTATAVAIAGNNLYFAHVGDSRLYLINANGIRQITEDHTYVQNLLRKGEISQKDAENHPERNVLIRAMGTNESLEVDASKIDNNFNINDRLLLCSDGLYDYMSNQEILKMTANGELRKCAYELIETAKNRGGHDNITVIIIESKSEGQSDLTKVTTDLKDLVIKTDSKTKEIT